MKSSRLLSLLLTLASKYQVATAQKTGHFIPFFTNVVECFQDMKDDGHFHWPLENKSLCDISSVFGPAISSCTGDYRFNRALAVHGERGDVVKAPYNGRVIKAKLTENDTAFVVVLEHHFRSTCEFHGHIVRTFYTTLDKLESISVSVGDYVSGGDPVGAIGDCTRHCGMSLLLGLRIGASCSLSYANEFRARKGHYPSCNNKGFDPAVNPRFLSPFVEEETHFTLQQSECWGTDDEGVIVVESSKINAGCSGADINKYEVTCGNKFHELDFNYREGYDPSSNDSLHAPPSEDVPYIEAYPFKYDSHKWEQRLHIPGSWYRAVGSNDCCTVRVHDTWGNYDEQEICGC